MNVPHLQPEEMKVKFIRFRVTEQEQEVHYFVENVMGKIVDGANVVVGRIGEWNGDYLVVKRTAVYHSHNTDGEYTDKCHWVYGLVAENENVKRVSVVGICTGYKAVVCGVVS